MSFIHKIIVGLVAVFVIATGAQNFIIEAQTTNRRDERERTAIRAVLDAQVAAWNRGDIEGFMDGYARGEDTTFVSGDTVTRGWQTVLDRYRRGYTSRERMGTLTFSELTIDVINRDTAIVLGRWQLQRAADAPRGRFTLIFGRRAGAWRIVHDHTSSASS